MILILCAEVGFENHFISAFWKKIGINNTACRINFALENFEPLIYRGPLAAMAAMACCQSNLNFSRGIFFDSLHSFYITYVDAFFTNDAHFIKLRDFWGGHQNAKKIIHFNDFEFKSYQRDGNVIKGVIIT